MKSHIPITRKLHLLLLAILLFCSSTIEAQINKVEYFVDTDPGFGLATGIPVTMANNIADQSASINLSAVPNGLHNLFIRSRDVAGNWSISNQVPFYKTSAVSSPNISRVEYFFDTDPGFGLATAIPIAAVSDISNQAASINLGSVADGFHNLFIRSRDADGKWSITNQVPFYKTGNVANGNITRVEYFIDADPGFGQATAISVGPGSDLNNQAATIDLSAMSDGFHNLFIRSKNASGLWSISNQVPFFKVAAIDSPNIVRSEYFIDTDPGFGLATPLIINPAMADAADKIIPVNISCLTIGSHNLFIRSQDANGKWSISNTSEFTTASVEPQAITVTSHDAANPICNGSSFKLTYDGGKCAYNAGNTFKVEISNAAGIFAATPPIIGTFSSTAKSGIINATLPFGFGSGTYKLRVSSTNPVITGANNGLTVTIVKPSTSAITGAIHANLATVYPYSVTNTTGSTYAWTFANGTQNSGGTANSVSATFNVAGIQSVSVTETNKFGCVGDAVSKNVNVYQLAISNTPATLTPCKGSTINISITSTGVFDAGNTFTAQLSDATGSFTNPVNIGSLNANPVGSVLPNIISATIPGNTADGTGYRIRIISSSPAFTGANNGSNITIIKPVTSAITGPVETNAGTAYQYSVTNNINNTYNWSFTNGTQNTGGTANSVTGTFNVAGTQAVSVTESSQFGCPGDAVTKNVTVYQLGITNTPIIINPCPGTGFTVNFSSTGVYDAGNIFTAQLSDATGSYASPVSLGSVNASPTGSNISNSINVTLPANTTDGNNYRIRVISNTPTVTGTNSPAMTVTTSDVFILTQNITVSGNLNMSLPNPSLFPCWRGGRLVLGNFNLTVNGNITGFDGNHFVVTNSTGRLKLVNANSTNTYPVGTTVGNPNFVRITNTGTPDNFSVSVKEGVLSEGTTGNPITDNNVNRTWNITEEITGGSNATVTLLWSPADELPGFDRNVCATAHYTTGPDWDFGSAGIAVAESGGQFSKGQDGYTSFSPFTVTNAFNTPLPVHLLSFAAKLISNKVLVQWQTSSEANTSHFVVQRSTDGLTFENIGNVQAAGYSNTQRSYMFDDATALALNKKAIYYRLKQVDKNDANTYSTIAKINLDNSLFSIRVYPNPVRDIIKLKLSTNAPKWLVTIFDANGKLAVSRSVNATPQVDIKVSNLAAGTYYIRLSDGSKQYTATFIKQ